MTRLTRGEAYARALGRELTGQLTNLARLASRLGLEVHEVDAEVFDGALIRARELPLGAIVIRKAIREPGRKNFTLAHEIGHFVLPGHCQTELVCADTDIGNWSDASKQIEREADEFAAELLMPGAMVQRIISSAAPSLQLIEKLAGRFRTSLSAAAWRYCDLAQEKCAIVWSTDEQIDWSKRSESFAFPLRKGTPIEKSTFASRAFAGLAIPKQVQEVPADSWITDIKLAQDTRLFEQSKALPAYRSVISLLWLRH